MLATLNLTFRQSLALTMAFYVAMAIWPFVGAATAERVGRRPAAIAGAIVLALTSIIAFSTHHLVVFAIAQVFGIGLLGWTWSVGQTYVAELFPTEVRGTGFGLGVAFGRIPSIAGPSSLAPSSARSGWPPSPSGSQSCGCSTSSPAWWARRLAVDRWPNSTRSPDAAVTRHPWGLACDARIFKKPTSLMRFATYGIVCGDR